MITLKNAIVECGACKDRTVEGVVLTATGENDSRWYKRRILSLCGDCAASLTGAMRKWADEDIEAAPVADWESKRRDVARSRAALKKLRAGKKASTQNG
jgi:hypothetical protein